MCALAIHIRPYINVFSYADTARLSVSAIALALSHSLCTWLCLKHIALWHSCLAVGMPRYYCDYCDTYLTHDSVSQPALLKSPGSACNFWPLP